MLLHSSDDLPEGRGWAYEVKQDGFRVLVFCDSDGVRVQSRNERCMTRFYPELQGLGAALGGRSCVLDGELVALDETGRPRFELMQQRAGVIEESGYFQHVRRGRHSVRPDIRVCYQIFDLLYLDGVSVMARPLEQRRALLEELRLHDAYWVTPSQYRGPDPHGLHATARQAGLEGLVAKRLDSIYRPGHRTKSWLKVKNWQRETFVLAGWREDPRGSGGWLGSLLLGAHEQAGLRYIAKLDGGVREPDLSTLRELLPMLERADSPFAGRQPSKPTKFVEPVLEIEVQFLERTSGGALRQARFKGLRARDEAIPSSSRLAALPTLAR